MSIESRLALVGHRMDPYHLSSASSDTVTTTGVDCLSHPQSPPRVCPMRPQTFP